MQILNAKLSDQLKGGEMMNNYTKLTHMLATVALVTTVLFSVAPIANAQTPGGQGNEGFFQGLMQFIEQKFGLDKSQVQSAVQQYQSQRDATITPRPTMTQQKISDREKSRLDKLVSSGKITSDQEQAILTELSSEQSKFSSLQGETPDQRKVTMQTIQNDLKTWAQSQNIDPMYVMPFGGGMHGGRGMMRGGHRSWNKPSGSPTPTQGS